MIADCVDKRQNFPMPSSILVKPGDWFCRRGAHLRSILRSEGQVLDLGKRACLLGTGVSCGNGAGALPDMISTVVCRVCMHAS